MAMPEYIKFAVTYVESARWSDLCEDHIFGGCFAVAAMFGNEVQQSLAGLGFVYVGHTVKENKTRSDILIAFIIIFPGQFLSAALNTGRHNAFSECQI